MRCESRLVAIAAVAGVILGCGRDHEFVCSVDTECIVDNTLGFCELDGACSFPDPSCGTGRRYGEFTNPARADRCVPFDIEILSVSTDSTIAIPEGTDLIMLVFAFAFDTTAPSVAVQYGGLELVAPAGASVEEPSPAPTRTVRLTVFVADATLLADAQSTTLSVTEDAGNTSTVALVLSNVDQLTPLGPIAAANLEGGGTLTTAGLDASAGSLVVIGGMADIITAEGSFESTPDFESQNSRVGTATTMLVATRPGSGLEVPTVEYVPEAANTEPWQALLGLVVQPRVF